MKRVVLDIHERQEEEDYQGKLCSTLFRDGIFKSDWPTVEYHFGFVL